jgi:transposase-like protein
VDKQDLKQFYQEFPNEEACFRFLERLRWPGGPVCPHCGGYKIYRFKDGRLMKCSACKKQFTAKSGTIFADSHISLQDWFLTLRMISASAGVLTSVQLADALDVTQKSAWFMIDRIRLAIPSDKANKRDKRPYHFDGSFEQAMAQIVR